MRRWTLVLAAVAVVATLAAAALAVVVVTDDSDAEERAAAPTCEHELFGRIAAVARSGAGYRLKLDPVWFTSGLTANTAAAEDGAVEPGEPVPNDNYRVDEGHRLLTYVLPQSAKVTVLTRQGDPANFGATPVTAAQLAGLLAGEKPVDLYESLDTGFWMRYRNDRVCSLAQQYQP